MKETIKIYEKVKKEPVKESKDDDQKHEINQLRQQLSEKEKLCEELRNSVQQKENKVTEFENKNSMLQENIFSKEDEIKILKFKQKQTEHLEFLNKDLSERLDKSQFLYKKLLEKEETFQQKISDLEFELYSKTIDVKSMSDTINRLNEKIQNLQGSGSTEAESSMSLTSQSSEGDSLSFNHSVVNELFMDIVNSI